MARQFPIHVTIHTKKKQFAVEAANALGVPDESELTPEAADRVDESRLIEMRKRGLKPQLGLTGHTGRLAFPDDPNGLKNVRVDTLFREAFRAGLIPIWGFMRRVPVRDHQSGGLTGALKYLVRVTLAIPRDGDGAEGNPTEAMKRIEEYYKDKTWVFCHVWENDANDAIDLVSEIDPLAKRYKVLRFNEGNGCTYDKVEPPERERRPARAT